jgi:hypothetical protein
MEPSLCQDAADHASHSNVCSALVLLLKDRVLRDAHVLGAPTINDSFYPAFVE